MPNQTKLYQTKPYQITNFQLQNVYYKLLFTNCLLQTANYKLPITNYKLPIANIELPSCSSLKLFSVFVVKAAKIGYITG